MGDFKTIEEKEAFDAWCATFHRDENGQAVIEEAHLAEAKISKDLNDNQKNILQGAFDAQKKTGNGEGDSYDSDPAKMTWNEYVIAARGPTGGKIFEPKWAISRFSGAPVDPAHVKTSHTPSREQIERVMRRAMAQFNYVFSKEMNHRDPNLNGKVVLKFTIGPEGTVENAVAEEPWAGEKSEMVQELIRTLQKLRFPAPGGGKSVDVTYPLLIKPDHYRRSVEGILYQKIRYLHERALDRNHDLPQGKVRISFAITADGSTETVAVTGRGIDDRLVQDIKKQIEDYTFKPPPEGAPHQISYEYLIRHSSPWEK